MAVVVPCFNDGATLPETLASLAGEEPHELVVVDDGSDDPETLETLARLRRDGVRVVHRENGGLSAARMTGVAETDAPYMMPLDADDELGPGALTALADALDARPEAGAAWGDVELFGAVELRLRMPATLDPWLFSFVNEVPGTSLLRRAALLEAGGWRLRGGYEDWDLWLSLAEAGWQGVHVPTPMLRYRQRPGRMNEDSITRHSEIYAHLRDLHPRLFAERARYRRASPEPRHVKMLWTLLDAVPGISVWNRHRLCRLIRDPRQQLASR
ncbi:MAG: glycosyltransferase family 2 protein [Gaiellaceae bacterium]